DAVPRDHRREGLPRSLHAVAHVLHGPAEARGSVAPPRLRERGALACLVRDGALLRRPPRLVPPVPGRLALAVGSQRAGSGRGRLRRSWIVVDASALLEVLLRTGTGERIEERLLGRMTYPTTNVGMLPPPALTLMTELREQRVTAPDSSPAT